MINNLKKSEKENTIKKKIEVAEAIEDNIVSELDDLDSSRVPLDISNYGFVSKFKLSKISLGLHSKRFNDFLSSHIKQGRYPVSVRNILRGKGEVSEKAISLISEGLASDAALLKDFVIYALVKELEVAHKMTKKRSLSEKKANETEETMSHFDTIFKQLFSRADSGMKELLSNAIEADEDIMHLVKISPKKSGIKAVSYIFGFAAVFLVIYSTAFFFIDTDASMLAMKTFLGLE